MLSHAFGPEAQRIYDVCYVAYATLLRFGGDCPCEKSRRCVILHNVAFVPRLSIIMYIPHILLWFYRDCPSASVIYICYTYKIMYDITERHGLGKILVSPGMCVDPSAHAQVMVIANNSC